MTDRIEELSGVRALVCSPGGPTVHDATDVVGAALGGDVEMVVLPVERLCADFFTLSSRVAGEIMQKFVNYRLRLVILGDMSPHVASSAAWRDLVRESNRGRHVWFVASPADLDARLSA